MSHQDYYSILNQFYRGDISLKHNDKLHIIKQNRKIFKKKKKGGQSRGIANRAQGMQRLSNSAHKDQLHGKRKQPTWLYTQPKKYACIYLKWAKKRYHFVVL